MTHIDQNHPVRALLLAAAYGNEPTSAQLDEVLTRTDLPDGHDLTRFRRKLAIATAKVAATASPEPNTHHYGAARRLADEYAAEFAGQMTDHEAALTGADPATVESLDAITSRMFGH